MANEVRLRVKVEYTITVTERGLTNYDDQSPKAIAAVERQNMIEEPAIIGADVFNEPYEVTVTPMAVHNPEENKDGPVRSEESPA